MTVVKEVFDSGYYFHHRAHIMSKASKQFPRLKAFKKRWATTDIIRAHLKYRSKHPLSERPSDHYTANDLEEED